MDGAESSMFNTTHAGIALGFGDSEFPNDDVKPIWPIIYGAAILLGAAVSAHCSLKIEREAAACAGNGCGAQIGPCGATCIDVCNNN
jgi:hypothetical protein